MSSMDLYRNLISSNQYLYSNKDKPPSVSAEAQKITKYLTSETTYSPKFYSNMDKFHDIGSKVVEFIKSGSSCKFAIIDRSKIRDSIKEVTKKSKRKPWLFWKNPTPIDSESAIVLYNHKDDLLANSASIEITIENLKKSIDKITVLINLIKDVKIELTRVTNRSSPKKYDFINKNVCIHVESKHEEFLVYYSMIYQQYSSLQIINDINKDLIRKIDRACIVSSIASVYSYEN